MFINEYTMTRWRYAKYMVPKFYRVPTFFLWVIIFVAGIFGWWYFDKVNAPMRWQTVGAFLTFCAVYRGVFFNWMKADKYYRLTRQKKFNELDWPIKVLIKEDKIRVYANGNVSNRVEWKQVDKVEYAKTYYKILTKELSDSIFLEKDAFTQGDQAGFETWMKEKHPEIEWVPIHPVYNR